MVGALAALRVILSTAVGWGRISSNPALGLRLPAPETGAPSAAKRVLTEEQLDEAASVFEQLATASTDVLSHRWSCFLCLKSAT